MEPLRNQGGWYKIAANILCFVVFIVALWLSAVAGLATTDLGIYVHVPFCSVRCGYCDFNTYTLTELGPRDGSGPTIGLDSHAAAAFDRMLGRLQDRDGFGVLLMSHESRHAWGRASKVYVMARGAIVANGTREELMTHPHEVARQLLNRRTR